MASPYKPQRGQRPSLEFRPIADLQIDPAYQRSAETGPSNALIKRMAREWDWSLCQPLSVSRRPDGRLFVIDGQHRLAAARQRRDIYDLPCVVMASNGVDDEAQHFVALNRQRRPLTALDLHRAAVAAGEETACALDTCLMRAGLSMAPHTNNAAWPPLVMGNVGGLKATLREHGPKVLAPALRVVATAWPDEPLRVIGTIWPGIAECMAKVPQHERADAVPLLAALLLDHGQAALAADIVRHAPDCSGGRRQAAIEIIARLWREANED